MSKTGRPPKETADWYAKQCKGGRSLRILGKRYGDSGEAFWWRLLDNLGLTPGQWLNCNDLEIWEDLVTQADEGTDCEGIMNLLARLGSIDEELWEYRIVWSQNFVDGLSRLYGRRKQEPPTKPLVVDIKALCGDKKRYSTGEERRGENSTGENSTTPSSEPSDSDTEFHKDTSEYQEAVRFYDVIRPNLHRKKVPNFTIWAKQFDLMWRVDGLPVDQVRRVYEFAAQDSFWRGNILSPKKLREKYDTLCNRMEKEQPIQRQLGSERWLAQKKEEEAEYDI